jgi:hypothetical protein
VCRAGEAGHVHADLGDELLSGGDPDPGDLIEPFGQRGERGDHRLDPVRHLVDLGGQRVDVGQHRLQQEAVVVFEVPGQRLL